ncbi:hypothetical protein Pmani_019226 [Petrolisthes manimaculis]|uniref:Uncharacterized protein n=1 Tax=Petrolisthes manimaculis TaxID=1843537 RepID=A0AAE1PIU3_9EUCA|nr:hypothetical protein Pmani_019226 [Petrolisthes manimaculis]
MPPQMWWFLKWCAVIAGTSLLYDITGAVTHTHTEAVSSGLTHRGGGVAWVHLLKALQLYNSKSSSHGFNTTTWTTQPNEFPEGKTLKDMAVLVYLTHKPTTFGADEGNKTRIPTVSIQYVPKELVFRDDKNSTKKQNLIQFFTVKKTKHTRDNIKKGAKNRSDKLSEKNETNGIRYGSENDHDNNNHTTKSDGTDPNNSNNNTGNMKTSEVKTREGDSQHNITPSNLGTNSYIDANPVQLDERSWARELHHWLGSVSGSSVRRPRYLTHPKQSLTRFRLLPRRTTDVGSIQSVLFGTQAPEERGKQLNLQRRPEKASSSQDSKLFENHKPESKEMQLSQVRHTRDVSSQESLQPPWRQKKEPRETERSEKTKVETDNDSFEDVGAGLAGGTEETKMDTNNDRSKEIGTMDVAATSRQFGPVSAITGAFSNLVQAIQSDLGVVVVIIFLNPLPCSSFSHQFPRHHSRYSYSTRVPERLTNCFDIPRFGSVG